MTFISKQSKSFCRLVHCTLHVNEIFNPDKIYFAQLLIIIHYDNHAKLNKLHT